MIMVKTYFAYPVFLIILFLSACSAGKQIIQLASEAEVAYQQGDFVLALEKFEKALEMNKGNDKVSDKLLNGAGLSAFALKDYVKALEYLEKVRFSGIAGEKTYFALSVLYREIDNLSREISTLKTYVVNYPEGQDFNYMQARLFETLVESTNYEDALVLWESLDGEFKQDEKLLSAFLIANRETKNDAVSLQVANELLLKNKDNLVALDWLAKWHFWLAENRYQSEMKAYENNKTRRQYFQLLAAFEILNRDFRISLNHFLKLYELSPSSEYARFIANIYTRFDDKQKADYYNRRAGQ